MTFALQHWWVLKVPGYIPKAEYIHPLIISIVLVWSISNFTLPFLNITTQSYVLDVTREMLFSISLLDPFWWCPTYYWVGHVQHTKQITSVNTLSLGQGPSQDSNEADLNETQYTINSRCPHVDHIMLWSVVIGKNVGFQAGKI